MEIGLACYCMYPLAVIKFRTATVAPQAVLLGSLLYSLSCELLSRKAESWPHTRTRTRTRTLML